MKNYPIRLVYTEISYTSCANFPKKRPDLAKLPVLPNFSHQPTNIVVKRKKRKYILGKMITIPMLAIKY